MVTGMMEINASSFDGACLLEISGDIDLSNVNVFIERLFELSVDGDQKIILDLCDVEFIDSTVINSLFAAAPRIRANGGDLAIVAADSAVSRALEISGVDVLYPMVHSRRQALERLGVTRVRTG
jgi:anti-sigma B factor antagonist